MSHSSNGQLARYSYDAWGNHLAILDGNGNAISTNASHIANINPIRYRGYYYDVETGFYYLKSRYYDPETGRFLNADNPAYLTSPPVGVGHNLYAYCGNNPVNHKDDAGTTYSDVVNWLNRYALNYDGSYSLYDNNRFKLERKRSVFHEQILVFNASDLKYSREYGSTEDVIGLGSYSIDLFTGGWEWENYNLSLFDFGHAEIGAEFNLTTRDFSVGAFVSAWSPSFEFEVFGFNVEVSFELGVGLIFGSNGYKVPGFGLSISK